VFNPPGILAEACIEQIRAAYERNYGSLDPEYGRILVWAARASLERIASSDALYHDMEHTIMVTLVGQEILRGKHVQQGGVSPRDWLHFMISLLFHDIGYVRGICRDDAGRSCTTGDGGRVEMPPGATDAFLTPYHVARSQTFVRERFGGHPLLDADQICAYIDLTRFPVPDESDSGDTTSNRALVRAADLIGQLADPGRMRKLPALFGEFQETGVSEALGFRDVAALRADYPDFFWSSVHPYIGDALRFLQLTFEGRMWVANLYAQVFAAEHDEVG
jgi:hypothetical protein